MSPDPMNPDSMNPDSSPGVADADLDPVREAVAAVLADRVTPEVLEAAERDGRAPAVWAALHDGGFATVSVPEAAGGSGGSVAEACAVLEEVGAAAAPVPAAETGLLAGRLLAAAGLSLPGASLSTASAPSLTLADGVLDGRVARVPWARAVDRLAFVVGSGGAGAVVVVDPAQARITPGSTLAGEPRDAVDLTGVVPLEVAAAPDGAADALSRRGALSRAALITGAARRVRELTVAYTGERVQFGRPVSRFPAVAEHLVRITEQAELAAMATRSAAAAVDADGEPRFAEVATAAAVAGEAAGLVAAAAHQATGAMGMTREFALGVLTRRLWSWRDEWGGERSWQRALGRSLADAGAAALWPTIAGGR